AGNPELNIILTGRNANMHNAEILVGSSTSALRPLTTVQFVAHENKTVTSPINWSDISSSGDLIVRVAVTNTAVTDYISISAVSISFPQQTDMQNLISKLFT